MSKQEELVMGYDRKVTRREMETQRAYADWTREMKWDWWATFTFSEELSEGAARARLERYLRLIEQMERTPLSCVIVREKTSGVGFSSVFLHYHVQIAAAKELNAKALKRIWKRPGFGGASVSGDAAYICPMSSALDPSTYSYKQIHLDADAVELRNLDLVSNQRPESASNSRRARRRLRRHAERTAPGASTQQRDRQAVDGGIKEH